MLDGHTQLAHVAGELLDVLVVAGDGVMGELGDLGGESLRLGDLAGTHARTLLVEDVLDLHGEDLAKLVELLGSCGGGERCCQ